MGEEEDGQPVVTSIEQTKNYVEVLKKLITEIEKENPKDRLEYALAITHCLNGSILSIKGWQTWINNLENLNSLTIEDLKEVYPKIKQAITDFLKADIDVTLKKITEIEQKTRNNDKKKKKAPYVS